MKKKRKKRKREKELQIVAALPDNVAYRLEGTDLIKSVAPYQAVRFKVGVFSNMKDKPRDNNWRKWEEAEQ